MSEPTGQNQSGCFSDAIKVALIGLAGVIIAALIGGAVTIFSPTLQHWISSRTSPLTAASSSVTPTPAQTLTVNPQSQFAYDFEQGTTQGWDTSEGQQKLATLQVVPAPTQPENHVLQVTTILSGDTSNNGVNLHTEAKVYFTQSLPHGFNNPPPYNFLSKQVSCQVYLPEQLALGNPAAIVKIFVKDTNQRNDFGKPITIDSSTVGKWIQVSLVVGEYQVDKDQGFDGTQSSAMGIRIDVPSGSSLSYNGPFYVDDCSLPH